MAEHGPENLKEIFNKECREALIEMIEAQGASEILSSNKKKNLALNTQADAPIRFSQLSKTNDLASAGDIFELGKCQKSPKKVIDLGLQLYSITLLIILHFIR